jgi:DNA-binding GntR family transcriptional regulator
MTGARAGELAPGLKLVEQALADRLQVSRVPVREAMPMLEAEGFVTTIPRRGTFVARLTVADVHDLFDLARTSRSSPPGGRPSAPTPWTWCRWRS